MQLFDYAAEIAEQTRNTPSAKKPRFSIPVPMDFLAGFIRANFIREVEKRGYKADISEDVEKRIKSVSNWLTNPDLRPSLLLYGSQPGTGKTTLARAIYAALDGLPGMLRSACNALNRGLDNEKIEAIRAILPEGYSSDSYEIREYDARIETNHPEVHAKAMAIVKEYRAKKNDNINETEEVIKKIRQPYYFTAQAVAEIAEIRGRDRMKDEVSNHYFIIIDDIGTEPLAVKNYGSEILPIIEVLTYRYEYRLPTILTSNLSDKGLSERYGERIGDRLNEICNKIAFIGESYRR